jgi:hypothetical protein
MGFEPAQKRCDLCQRCWLSPRPELPLDEPTVDENGVLHGRSPIRRQGRTHLHWSCVSACLSRLPCAELQREGKVIEARILVNSISNLKPALKNPCSGEGQQPRSTGMPRDRTDFLLSPAEHAASVEASPSRLDAHSWWKRAEMHVRTAASRLCEATVASHARYPVRTPKTSSVSSTYIRDVKDMICAWISRGTPSILFERRVAALTR